jgi:uncharacterized protein (TIGR03437 family)
MSLYATGIGNTIPPASTGEVLPLEARPLAEDVSLRINPVGTMDILYAGAAPGFISGLSQVNFRLPATYAQTQSSAPNTLQATLSVRSSGFFNSPSFVIHFRP